MRILLINDYSEPDGGTEVYFKTLRLELEKENFEVYTFCISQSYEKKGKDIVHKVSKSRLIRYLEGLTINPVLYFKIKKLIKTIKPDVIHLHDIDRFPASILLPLIGSKAKVVRTIHDYGFVCPSVWSVKKDNLEICEAWPKLRCVKHCIPFHQYLVYKYFFLMKHFLYHHTIDEYIAPSKKLIEYLSIYKMTPIHYVPFYIENTKTEKNIGKNNILYIGSLSEQKGIKYLIKAMPYIKKEIKDATLSVIGRGELEQELKVLAKEIELNDSINFVGILKHDDVLKQYFKHSVVAVPSIWMEQFSLVGLEATQAGTPVVASRIGGIPDWLKEGKNGYFAKRADEKDIAEKIVKTIKSSKIQKEITLYKKVLEERFSKQKHLKNLKKIYFI